MFVEWPIAENLERAVELMGDKRVDDSIVDLQTRFRLFCLRSRKSFASGKIGKISSSQIIASPTVLPRGALSESLGYFAERVAEGNAMSIEYVHMIDFVHDVLGEFESFGSRMQTQRPSVTILRKDNTKIRDMYS